MIFFSLYKHDTFPLCPSMRILAGHLIIALPLWGGTTLHLESFFLLGILQPTLDFFDKISFQNIVYLFLAFGKQILTICFAFQDLATYTCDSDFQIVGVGRRSCQASGRWSGWSSNHDVQIQILMQIQAQIQMLVQTQISMQMQIH